MFQILGRICSDGFIIYPENCKCYSFNNTALNWYDSYNYCKNQGAASLVITTAGLNCFLAQLAATSEPRKDGLWTSTWIGLQCHGHNASNCYWIDGTPLSDYINIEYGCATLLVNLLVSRCDLSWILCDE